MYTTFYQTVDKQSSVQVDLLLVHNVALPLASACAELPVTCCVNIEEIDTIEYIYLPSGLVNANKRRIVILLSQQPTDIKMTHLQQQMVLKYSLNRCEEVGAERQKVTEL